MNIFGETVTCGTCKYKDTGQCPVAYEDIDETSDTYFYVTNTCDDSSDCYNDLSEDYIDNE